MTQLSNEQKAQFLSHVDSTYRILNRVASYTRANKIFLDDPMDVASLTRLAVAAQSLSDATAALIPQTNGSKK